MSELTELLLGYVISEGDSQAGEALVQHLAQAGWPAPLSETDTAELRNMLIEDSGLSKWNRPPASLKYLRHLYCRACIRPGTLAALRACKRWMAKCWSCSGRNLRAWTISCWEIWRLIVDPRAFCGRPAGCASQLCGTAGAAFSRGQIDRDDGAECGICPSGVLAACDPGALHPDQNELLKQLPGRVAAYLATPNDASAAAALVDLLAIRHGARPLTGMRCRDG